MNIAKELIQRLFDGPVPLLTKKALYLLLYVISVFCALFTIDPLYGVFGLIELSFLVAVIGFAIQYLFFKFQYSSFAHLEQENVSDGVFDNAMDNTTPNPFCRIWICPAEEPFIISVSNIAFRAILISNPLAEKMRVDAKRTTIVLAKKMLDVEHAKVRVHAILGVVFFVGVWLFHALWFFPYIHYPASFPYYYWGPHLTILVFYPVGASFFKGTLRALSWKRDRSMVETYRTYGVLPQIAYIELLQEGPISVERKSKLLRTYEKQEVQARAERRSMALIALFTLGGFVSISSIMSRRDLDLFLQSTFFTLLLLSLMTVCLFERYDTRAVSEFWSPLIDDLEPVWPL